MYAARRHPQTKIMLETGAMPMCFKKGLSLVAAGVAPSRRMQFVRPSRINALVACFGAMVHTIMFVRVVRSEYVGEGVPSR